MEALDSPSLMVSEAHKVLFQLEHLFGAQTEDEMATLILDILAACDKGGRDDAMQHLQEMFGDSVSVVQLGKLIDTVLSCKTSLIDMIEQAMLQSLDDSEQLPAISGDSSGAVNGCDVAAAVSACFSALSNPNATVGGRLPMPPPVNNTADTVTNGSTEQTSLADQVQRIGISLSQYANHAKYSMVFEAKHAHETAPIAATLQRLDMNEQLARVYSPVVAFNSFQLQVVEPIHRGGNTIVAAPTGAGKTNVAIWAMLCTLEAMQKKGDNTPHLVIYTAPLKALVREVIAVLERAFAQLPRGYDACIYEYTGEKSIATQELITLLSESRPSATLLVLVATPEKLDVLTSKLIDAELAFLRRCLSLVLFDEVHLLGDTARGSVIETLVLRFHRHYGDTMLLALSATVPNIQEVASFLRCAPENTLVFDSSYRAISLQVSICDIYYKYSEQRYSRPVRERFAMDLVSSQLSKGSILIFTHTRGDAERLALQLQSTTGKGDYSRDYAKQCAHKKLCRLLADKSSVLFHHAGLQRADRKLVEEMFSAKSVQVLVSTATLAWGVNLPAHTVIVLGTQIYSDFSWQDTPSFNILQMVGRAGRPSFDTFGECFIIPSPNDAKRCLSIFTSLYSIESSFATSASAVDKLVRLVLTEAFLSAYLFRDEVVQIVESSFFGLQLRQRCANQLHYRSYIDGLCASLVQGACATGLLEVCPGKDSGDGREHYRATSLAELAIQYYVSPFTVFTLNRALSQAPIDSLHQAILLVAMSNEYSSVILRADEEFELAQLENYAPLKLPVPATRKELVKICILLQIYISTGPCYGEIAATFGSLSLTSDYANISSSAPRIVGCMSELSRQHRYSSTQQTFHKLYCMLTFRCWPVFLFARECLGNPLFKSSVQLCEQIKWIEQLETGKFSKDTLQNLTLDHFSQLLIDKRAPNGRPSQSEVLPLFTVIKGFPALHARFVRLFKIEDNVYKVCAQFCLIGEQALLRNHDTALSVRCLIESEDKACYSTSVDMCLNEEVTATFSFTVDKGSRIGRMHIFVEELFFCSRSLRLDFLASNLNMNMLASRKDGQGIIESSIDGIRKMCSGILAGSRQPGDPILIVGHELYVEQAKLLRSLITDIQQASADSAARILVVGRQGGGSRQVAAWLGLKFMETADLLNTLRRTPDSGFERAVIILPFLCEISEPMGHILETLLMDLVSGDKEPQRCSTQLVAFALGLNEASINAMAVFLGARIYVLGPSTLTWRFCNPPADAQPITPESICCDPDIIYRSYEQVHISVANSSEDSEDNQHQSCSALNAALSTPFLHAVLAMCNEHAIVYVTTNQEWDSASMIAIKNILEHRSLTSQLASPDGLFMLLANRRHELVSNGFDYAAEQVITLDIPRTYLYHSFAVLPSQYIGYKTMLNYHPKCGEEDLAREEETMLDALANWISGLLIDTEECVMALLCSPESPGATFTKEGPTGCSFYGTDKLPITMLTVFQNTCMYTGPAQEDTGSSLWLSACIHALHMYSVLSLCAIEAYADKLTEYMWAEKALQANPDSQEALVLSTIIAVAENAEEQKGYALMVTLQALIFGASDAGQNAIACRATSTCTTTLRSSKIFTSLCTTSQNLPGCSSQ